MMYEESNFLLEVQVLRILILMHNLKSLRISCRV